MPADSVLCDSTLPRRFPSAARITATATPLLKDPPGRVRLVAFWGEPGAHEPGPDTPTTFLGVDGRWRKLSVSDLADGEIGWLGSSYDTLSPDGSRWILEVGGRNQLVNFRTGKLIGLRSLRSSSSTSGSPDSGILATWATNQSGVHVFDRSGRPVADLPIDVGKRTLFASDDGGVTIAQVSGTRSGTRVRLKTYDRHGEVVESLSCAVPAGYRASETGLHGYDGQHLWLRSLNDKKRWVYRYAMIDVRSGTLVWRSSTAASTPTSTSG